MAMRYLVTQQCDIFNMVLLPGNTVDAGGAFVPPASFVAIPGVLALSDAAYLGNPPSAAPPTFSIVARTMGTQT